MLVRLAVIYSVAAVIVSPWYLRTFEFALGQPHFTEELYSVSELLFLWFLGLGSFFSAVPTDPPLSASTYSLSAGAAAVCFLAVTLFVIGRSQMTGDARAILLPMVIAPIAVLAIADILFDRSSSTIVRYLTVSGVGVILMIAVSAACALKTPHRRRQMVAGLSICSIMYLGARSQVFAFSDSLLNTPDPYVRDLASHRILISSHDRILPLVAIEGLAGVARNLDASTRVMVELENGAPPANVKECDELDIVLVISNRRATSSLEKDLERFGMVFLAPLATGSKLQFTLAAMCP
jgi:hypothetical protein